MKIAVVGGGPAGMMAAIAAANSGADVTLFEKNEKLGKKLYISGKGRCNITNDCSPREFLNNVVTNSKFLFGSVSKFSPQSTIDFCTNNGLQLKTERGKRVFPLSDKSVDVIKFFSRQLDKSGVKVFLNTPIKAVQCQKSGISLTTISDIVYFDKVILATGGVSYKATGSTGDGYTFARSLGHTVVPPKSALCKIRCQGTQTLEGLSLKNVTVSVWRDEKKLDEEFGEMLFAADGISGPAALTLSSRLNKRNVTNGHISLDLKPALDSDKLNARILRDFAELQNKDFINSLDALLPLRLIKAVALQSQIPFDKKVNQITVAERARLVRTFKDLRFRYVGLDDVEHSIVTCGGVEVKQVDPSTMESKLCKGVYFAGELLDVDGYTGGFNIQIALSTGYVAGLNAAKEE